MHKNKKFITIILSTMANVINIPNTPKRNYIIIIVRRKNLGVKKKITKLFCGTIPREKLSDFRINPIVTRTKGSL